MKQSIPLILTTCALTLGACAPGTPPVPDGALTPPVDILRGAATIAPGPGITIAFVGNDGAAAGQQGIATLTEAGRLRCELTSADFAFVPGGPPSLPSIYEAETSGLFDILAAYIRENGVTGVAPPGPNIASLITASAAFHIPVEDPETPAEFDAARFFGAFSPVGTEIGALLAQASDFRCLPFG